MKLNIITKRSIRALRTLNEKGGDKMRYKAIYIFLILIFLTGCSGKDFRDPENYRYFDGTVTHYFDKILTVQSGTTKIAFRVGRSTIFTPIRILPSVGDRVNVRYFMKEYSSYKIGKYFIAFEVHKVKK